MITTRQATQVLALLALGRSLLAQTPADTRLASVGDALPGCLDKLPPEVFKRVTVYLEYGVVDSANRAMQPSADVFVRVVGERLRSVLGAAGRLPLADSTLSWRQVGGTLRVVARRDGALTWSDPGPQSLDTLQRPSLELLRRVLSDVRDSAVVFVWPAGVTTETFAFDVSYLVPTVTPDGKIEHRPTRFATPVFSLMVPWSTPTTVRRNPRLEYPRDPQRGGAIGTVVMQFVVDTSGVVDPATISDVWPPDRPPLTGGLAEYYRDFVGAAKQALAYARYKPARIGGCVVRQPVYQEFDFSFRR